MNEVERYLSRATRGLWGTRKEEAQMELRGAIEDKVHRYTLLGLNEPEAITAALRDLGNPNVIARELNAIHTVPVALRTLLLISVAGTLGLKAVAGVPGVKAWPSPDLIRDCHNLPRTVKTPNFCIKPPNMMLSLSGFTKALKAGGIEVRTIADIDGLLELTPPGQPPSKLDLRWDIQKVNGELIVGASTLLERLVSETDLPLKLTGLENPVLQVGQAKVQLGNRETPINSAPLYAMLSVNHFLPLFNRLSAQEVRFMTVLDPEGQEKMLGNTRLNVPNNTLYVLLSNENFTRTKTYMEMDYVLRLNSVQNGRLTIPLRDTEGHPAQIVNTPQELLTASTRKQYALLIYRLDATALRNLNFTPVEATEFR